MAGMKFLLRTIVTAVAVWVTTLLPLGVSVTGGEDGEWWQRAGVYLLVGAVIALLSAVVKPIVKALTLPLYILTLGLFSIVIAWLMLWLAAWITSWSFFPWATLELGDFWRTVLAALVLAIVTAILSVLVPGARKH